MYLCGSRCWASFSPPWGATAIKGQFTSRSQMQSKYSSSFVLIFHLGLLHRQSFLINSIMTLPLSSGFPTTFRCAPWTWWSTWTGTRWTAWRSRARTAAATTATWWARSASRRAEISHHYFFTFTSYIVYQSDYNSTLHHFASPNRKVDLRSLAVFLNNPSWNIT